MIPALLHIFFSILFSYVFFCCLYLLIAAVAGLRRTVHALPEVEAKNRIAVLITAFREDEVIINTIAAATTHDYPPERFTVFLAADGLRRETIERLRNYRVRLHEVSFERGSKARSLNLLLNAIDESQYDVAVVLDGDNVMRSGFLEQVNTCFQRGALAVQGHRAAKNLNTPVAVLDAVSEEINNHLFRRAQQAMRLSAATIGSGMAFPFRKLKEIYNKPGIIDNPACDREVDFEMMKSHIVVEYIDTAIVYDEKVSRRGVYTNQRRRWLESQLFHLGLFFSRRKHVAEKDANYWNKLFINLIAPRILLMAAFIPPFVAYAADRWLHLRVLAPAAGWWAMLLGMFLLAMVLSIPRALYTWRTARAFLALPGLLISFLFAAFTVRAGRKEFVHTPKSFTE